MHWGLRHGTLCERKPALEGALFHRKLRGLLQQGGITTGFRVPVRIHTS
jgi:hypothetical protein